MTESQLNETQMEFRKNRNATSTVFFLRGEEIKKNVLDRIDKLSEIL